MKEPETPESLEPSESDVPVTNGPAYVEEEIDADELVAEDDSIIGQALRWSVALLLGVGLLVALGLFLARRGAAPAPATVLDARAPEVVTEEAEPPQLHFTDVTAASGIDFVRVNGAYGDKLLPETMGGGVALVDFDDDGDEDLFFVNGSHWPFAPEGSVGGDEAPASALFANDGKGVFRDVSAASGIRAATRSFYGMGVAVGDADGDGRVDLFLTGLGGNRLLRNRGGTFEDVTRRAGVAGEPDAWSTCAAFFDADGDGDLDLFVCNYVRWSKEIDFAVDYRLTGVGRAYGPPQSYEGTFPYFYSNQGDGRFSDVSAEAGVQVTNEATGAPMAKSLALAPVDVDGDGALDLLVANDTVRNFLFHNLGDGTFEEVGEYYGIAYDRQGSATGAMGTDVGYLGDDRNLAFLIGNFANEMTSVYVAQDDPTAFVDEAISEGIGAPSRRALSFGLFLFDVDLDGRLDLLQANGHLEEEIATVDPSQRYRQPAQLYWNAGEAAARRFVQLPPEDTGDLGREIVGRSTAYGDIDGDGDLDVIITQAAGSPLLLRNDQQTGHHWLRVQLVGPPANRQAIGAGVTVRAGGREQHRQVMPTRSYLAQVELPVTFGLGGSFQVDGIDVTWPDGTTQKVDVVEVDRLVVIEHETG